MKNIPSGERETLVRFEAPITESDDHGGWNVTGWTALHTAWCRLTPVSARERLRTLQLEQPITHALITPYCAELAGLTHAHRAVVGSRLMNIVSIINAEESSVEWEILVDEGMPT